MTESRKILDGSDLCGFDKRKLPSPGFQLEVVMIDYDGTSPSKPKTDSASKRPDGSSVSVTTGRAAADSNPSKVTKNKDDDVFSDSDGEEAGSSKSRQHHVASGGESAPRGLVSNATVENLSQRGGQTVNNASKEVTTDGGRKPTSGLAIPYLHSVGASDIKSMAADASIFTFGDEEDDESE